jgi:alpha-galactosidase
LQTDAENRLRTIYFGESLSHKNEYSSVSDLFYFDEENVGIYNSTYTPSCTWNLVEPAIQIKHADGNYSLELKYVSHKKEQV